MCTFFSKSKTGSQAITFIQLIINFLYFLRFSKDLTDSNAFTIFLSIFPQLCFNITVSNIAFVTDPRMIDYNFKLPFGQGVLTLLISTVVYCVIALYLE